jgi:hypothetical protein
VKRNRTVIQAPTGAANLPGGTVDSATTRRVTKAGYVVWTGLMIVIALYSVNAAIVFGVISLVLFFRHTAKMFARTRAVNAAAAAAGQAA